MTKLLLCPCGSSKKYVECCGQYLDSDKAAPNAESLMRSRYTAYTMLCEDYVLATWHSTTRPVALGLADEVATKWLGLEIKRHEQQQPGGALVEFVARYKVNGRAHRLHEVSRFVHENGKWFYLEGESM